LIQQLPQYQRPFITIVALVLAFILALKTLRAVRPQMIAAPANPRALGAAGDGVTSVDAALTAASQPVLQNSQQAQMLARSAQAPDMAARVIRSWMREG
jgi:flagellar biosynthesis/type III secretory pathway M-ring protein FliF/YscJ